MRAFIIRHWLLVLLFLAIALFFTYPSKDVDLGWHLRYGEMFLKTGQVVRDNQFSWALPDFRWANHSWGFDVIAAFLFDGSRFWLLSLAAGVIVAASLLLVLPSVVSVASLITVAIFCYFGTELLSLGLRSQFFSLLFTAIMWRWITVNLNKKLSLIKLKRYSGYWLIALFLFWSNLHGQFVYGLGILALSFTPFIWKTRSSRLRYQLLGILIGSAAATLINPFGTELWQTAIGHFNAPALKYIYEWMPWELWTARMGFLLFYVAVCWWGVRRRKLPLPITLPLAATTVLALSSRRMIPYFLLMSLPFMVPSIDEIMKKLSGRIQPQTLRFVIPVILFAFAGISFTLFFARGIFTQSWDTYCQSNVYCSGAAIRFMRDNHITGKLFNAYRLGGYLIYRYPEMKPMVDGRMTLWQDKDGSAPFLDYTSIVYTETGSREKFLAINPDYVLIQPQYPLAQTLLRQGEWPVIYGDDKVLLFKNPRQK